MLSKTATFILIALGTVVGLAGIDLVLPAIPGLPDALGGDLKSAQYVLAAFAGGTGIGLLVYGELGARFKLGTLLVLSLTTYAVLSLLATLAPSTHALSLTRFFQGLAAAGPAVFAPVMIKSMYDETGSIIALGRLGSIESITPALAPVLGAWLLTLADWKLSFYVTAFVAIALSLAWVLSPATRRQFGYSQRSSTGGYSALFKNLTFLRHAISQAFTLGALLIIVFAAPVVITHALDGSLSDFIIMQVTGIAFFILAANTSHRVVQRLGAAPTILLGTACTALGCVALFIASVVSKPAIELIWLLFVFVNLGLGIRGPAGFFQALKASGDNDSRGSALIILFVMLTTALGTAAVAPFVEQGFVQVAARASAVAIIAVWLSISRRQDRQ
ncbi:MAG: MFS transporter [Pseudomonadota bacterium]